MTTIDKSIEETFTLIEECSRYVQEPPIYMQTRNNLLAYRTKVMADIVGGRVNASLDAGHDSLVKYKTKLSGLNIVAYLFKNMRHNALALILKGKTIGGGAYRGIGVDWDSPTAMYPLNPPYQVPQRLLPQVDIFRYEPISGMELGTQIDMSQFKAFCTIQSGKSEFIDTPDTENAVNDFYFFYPQCKIRGRWLFTNPTESGYQAWSGEYIQFQRELRTDHIETCYAYGLLFWFNADVEREVDSEPTRETPPVLQWNFTTRREHDVWYTPSNAPVLQYGLSGNRYASNDDRLYCVLERQVRGISVIKRAETFSIESSEVVWYNHWNIEITVNDPLKGTTDPVPDKYVKQALDGFEVTAEPIPPASFDHWELDGVNIGNTNPYYLYPLKDQILKAVFV